jgi:hypothetical protein
MDVVCGRIGRGVSSHELVTRQREGTILQSNPAELAPY